MKQNLPFIFFGVFIVAILLGLLALTFLSLKLLVACAWTMFAAFILGVLTAIFE